MLHTLDATVFMVDGDAHSRSCVHDLVSSMDLTFEGFSSGHEFFEAYQPDRLGCLVTEVRTIDIGGLEMQRRLAASEAPLPVIFQSSHTTLPIVVRAMKEGAVDFLAKPVREQELWEVIQEAFQLCVVRHQHLVKQREFRRLMDRLSPKERQILASMADGKRRREIASDMNLSVRTVESARVRAMKKLGVDTTAGLLRFVIAAQRDFGSDVEGSGSPTIL